MFAEPGEFLKLLMPGNMALSEIKEGILSVCTPQRWP
jgi:hypothetical protein